MAAIQIDVLADVTQATKSIAGFTDKVEKQFSSLLGVVQGVAAVIGVGFGFKEAIDQASQFEEAVNNLNIALKLTGIGTEEAQKALLEFADNIQKTTTVSDDAALSAAALLQNIARLSSEGLQKGTKAAIDLSSALGIDLDSAVRLVGKAAEGNVEAFKRYGIAIEKGKNDSETFANTLQALSRFSGSAEAKTNTFAGAMTQLTHVFDDNIKKVGLGIIQNQEIINGIKELTEGMIKLIPKAAQFGILLGTGIVDGAKALGVVFNNLPGLIAGAATAWGLLNAQLVITQGLSIFATITRLAGAFSLLLPTLLATAAPFVAIAAAVAAVSVGVGLLVQKFVNQKKVTDALIESNDKLALSLNDVNAQRAEQRSASGNTSEDLLAASHKADELRAVQVEFTKFFTELQKNSADELLKVETNEKEKFQTLEDFRKSGAISVQQYSDAYSEILNSSNAERLKIIEAQEKKEFDLKKKAFDEQAKLFASALAFIKQGGAGVGGALAAGAEFGIGQISNLGAAAGPLGAAAGSAVGFLGQGPDAVQQQIQAFVDNVPVIIQAIVDSIPVVIDTLVERAPDIITRLVELAPELAIKVGLHLAIQMPFVAVKLATSLIAETPNMAKAFINSLVSEAGRFITALIDGIKGAFSGLAGGGGLGGILKGGAIGGALAGPAGAITAVAKKFKFAEGGVVPGGAPFTDRVPALLTPGEVVLPRREAEELKRGNNSAAQSASQAVTINLLVGEQQLASVLVNLQRQGFRLTP